VENRDRSPGKPTWVNPCQSTGRILPLSSEVKQSRWSLNEMTICQKKIHGKKNEFNGYKPVELNHFSQKKRTIQ
jgi:hypothetical protein